MLWILLTKPDMRVSACMEIEQNSRNVWDLQNPKQHASVIVDEYDFDPAYNLADYRFDKKAKQIILDPIEEKVEYFDLESGQVTQLTSDDIDNMVSEKVKNQVEAMFSEMLKDNKSDLLIASQKLGE